MDGWDGWDGLDLRVGGGIEHLTVLIKHSIALHMSSTYRRTEHPDHKGSPSHPGCKGYQGNGFGSHPDASGFLKYCIVKACFLGVLMLFVWGRWCFCRQALPYVKVLPYYVKVTKETGLEPSCFFCLLPYFKHSIHFANMSLSGVLSCTPCGASVSKKQFELQSNNA